MITGHMNRVNDLLSGKMTKDNNDGLTIPILCICVLFISVTIK